MFIHISLYRLSHSLSTTDNWAHVNRELVHQDWDVLYKKLAEYVDKPEIERERVQTLMNGRIF
jgi:hypothetical protein